MTTYATTVVCEEHGSPSESLTRDAITASVVLRCNWSDRWALMAELIGGRAAWPYATGFGAATPRAQSASARPFPSKGVTDGQAIVYADALVTVNYTTAEEEDLVAESLETNVEFQQLDFRRFRWGNAAGDPLIEAEAPGRQLFSMVLARTLFKVEPPLPASLLTLPGKSNSAAYVSALLGLTFPIETLIFGPPSMSRTISTAGNFAFDVSLMFPYKPEGWNKFWRAETESYEEMWNMDGAAVYKNYPPDDFSAFLF
jgi:hypothetical protein